MVLVVGETETLPEVPLGVKLVPVQEVALVEDQVRVEELPAVMEAGEAVRVAVGAGVVLGAGVVVVPPATLNPAIHAMKLPLELPVKAYEPAVGAFSSASTLPSRELRVVQPEEAVPTFESISRP